MIPLPTDKVSNLNLILTHNCNSKCVCCDYWKSKCTSMPLNRVVSIVDKLVPFGLKSVFLTGGEVSTSLNFEDVINILKFDYKLKVKVATNGILSSKISDCVLRIVDQWTISLDSMSNETYQLVRGVNKRDNVISFIDRVCSKGTKINTVSFLLQRSNMHELIDALYFAYSKQLNFSLLLPQLQCKFGDNNSTYDSEVFNYEDYFIINLIIEYLEGNVKWLCKFSNISIHFIERMKNYFSLNEELNSKMHKRCSIPISDITIGFDGANTYQKMCFFDKQLIDFEEHNFVNSETLQFARGEFFYGESKKTLCNKCVQYF